VAVNNPIPGNRAELLTEQQQSVSMSRYCCPVGEKPVPGYLAALTIVLLLGIVLTRVIMMKSSGTRAVHFGNLDKTDFLIPPFALFYFYTVFAAAFDLPLVSTQEFFQSEVVAWVGVALCFGGLILLLLSLVSFGQSFRVGIDVYHPDKLITTGIFALSRNPIYVGFAFVLLGQFLGSRIGCC
jgi:protein-S-isoprenylcysteine O-methyltransferase Ste14